MESLSTLEQALIERLTEKYSSLNSHVTFLRVASRQASETGIVVTLAYQDTADMPERPDIEALFSTHERIHVKGLRNGLGYVIDVTEGMIQFIEFMTYSEKWNGRLEEYEILPLSERS